ncbi:uncharacterized protein A4U43_C08F20820 [Asparagus officinalis]|nr:uncharacterized protein A4U43_C08F20820 [Asparagus officinalis]
MSENLPDFVEWREQYINQERGSRLVHYYLEDSSGESYLAVVGTERSLRHMLYVASEEFSQAYGLDKSGVLPLKWRSRREVIDWLTSFIPGRMSSRNYFKSPLRHSLGSGMSFDGVSDTGSYQHRQMGFCGSLYGQSLDIVWTGISWTCGKQLRHYQAFSRNGITIGTHSFVLVMSEGENRYLAYLEDMYEDKKGQKKVKVRWFHQNQEFACKIPRPTPHPCEVFITPYSQVISAECVDDIATVLTPDHYEKCLATLPYSSCKQNSILLSTVHASGDEDEFGHESTIKRGSSKRIRFVKGAQKSYLTHRLGVTALGHANHISNCKMVYQNSSYDLSIRRPLSVKFIGPQNYVGLPFNIDDKVELLCQDSGIRGCWFKCTVSQLSQKRLKVRYDDVRDEDGCGNLEEWVLALRKAAPDKLGMRCSGRLNIRPSPSIDCLLENAALEIGTPVDAWWSDGWWEGVVTGVESSGDDSVQVYFPGEDIFLICQRRSLRISRDWLGNQWVEIQAKPDILSVLSLVDAQAKLTSCSVLAKGAESGSSVMSDRGPMTTQTNSNSEDRQIEASLNESDDDLLGNAIQGVDTKDRLDSAPAITDTIIGKETESESPGMPKCEAIAVLDNSKGEDEQTEASLTERNADALVENAEQLNPRKRRKDEDSDENQDSEIGIDGASSRG